MKILFITITLLISSSALADKVNLTIKKDDGAIYWKEQFNDQLSADKWIAQEKKRPYWNGAYVVETVSVVEPSVPVADQSKITAREQAKVAIKSFDKTKVKDLGEALDVIEKLIKAQGLNE